MPIAHTDQLFQLIKSLDKAEKRNFKLYVKRLESNKDPLFLKVFEVLDKMEVLDENALSQKLAGISSTNLINIKRHLYAQIITSLRLIHNKKEVRLQIREHIDYAEILYGKGLYLQALKILDKAKIIAEKANQDLLLFEVLEFEKLIESRHITRSRQVENKVEWLIDQSQLKKEHLSNASDLLNLNLKIHGFYIKKGHVRTELDRFILRDYFYSNLRNISKKPQGFFEKVYLHQAYMWYYYTCLELPWCYRHSKKWVDTFLHRPYMITKDPDLLMRGLHYLLTSVFYMKHRDAFRKYFRKFEDFYDEYHNSFNATTQLTYFIYGWNARINNHFLKGEFTEVANMIPEIEKELQKFDHVLDKHRRITFYYKISWALIALGDYNQAIDYINRIFEFEQSRLRNEVLCYIRILQLIAHHHLGHHEWVHNTIPSVVRYFKVYQESNPVQKEVIKFLSGFKNAGQSYNENILKILKNKLELIFKDSLQQRPFIYFNFIDWIRAIENKTTIEMIVKKDYSDYLDNKLYK